MAKKMKVIGIGDDGQNGLSSRVKKWIEQADVLAGGERQLSFFPDHPGRRILIKGGLGPVLEQLERESRQHDVVVLASGDPLFYGIASLIVRKLGLERVVIHPHPSSLQLAFARMGESWQQVRIESVHGRPMKGLAQRIDGQEKVALLTDEVHSPGEIARYLLQFGMTEYRAFVAENLGGPEERCGWWELDELVDAEFSPLNIVVLKRKKEVPVPRWSLGIEDGEFFQRKPEKGLITKKEVRVLSLAELRLQKDSTVWDIGAGSGSVSVEAAKLAPFGEVFAIEKNEADLANIEANRRKFRADFTVIHAKAPEGLDSLPDPDAVFIGGSGGELCELLRVCCLRLKSGGRIVVNAATVETLAQTRETLAAQGFSVRITLLQTARSRPILQMTRFEGMNPINVIVGERDHTTGEGRA
ncbi:MULTISPECIES: precorrin-6y C5,15-methyltransferase (decarboxylating) subunit CbiE [unclassified Thermoactinomyces]|uniref:precorrin-6y C5,15-methyltransferase (decarboxylating) subunit CbiE n=1 Tax=unclassified Thermoactinomyces TaxID=2634588 RepID=UPI0018DC6918|nr:precorrin-6y C5,15-methyltransferase (decarboxylating) subunit CbiE [Thermoactinomyces sp. CICC 10523]MBH8605301.1 precorrin-6y C5,15-methyltransferase (decarboxylating) subunit CbiE [Thermoactinomyces sp. CICC 10522]MBH8608212.1 precorrin-6y C5,15-methyltransferase (decarboxylating) subunit CbiE [Thermoactinomyces sp. CICC 10521]